MNALDNRGCTGFANSAQCVILSLAARNHVNRLCLAADVPLIESGTAGYLGQVTVIKKVGCHSAKTFFFRCPMTRVL